MDHSRLGFIIERAGRLVEHKDARTFVKRARNADALPLAAGKSHSALSHRSAIAPGEACNKVRNISMACSLTHAIHVDLPHWDAEGDIFRDGCVGEIDGLRNMGNLRLPMRDSVCVKDTRHRFGSRLPWVRATP